VIHSDGALHSWAGVGHGPPRKIKKLTIIDLLCETLYNFVSILGLVDLNFCKVV